MLVRFVISIAACALALTSTAVACPDDQYESCILSACVCLPKVGGDIGRAGEHIKEETQGQVGGHALAVWLQGSRDSAIGTAQPIPLHIRQQLAGYVEEDILNRVRFKVGDSGILNLAGLSIAYGDRVFGDQVAAVTLIDLVVFRDHGDAMGNVALWAHELWHVKQFRDWGVRDFAIRYARNSNDVEGPAHEAGNNYVGWRMSQGAPPASVPPPFPAVLGMFCGTPFGRFGPGPANPIGSPCHVATPNGPVFGQVVQ